jgi:hypothetical protein
MNDSESILIEEIAKVIDRALYRHGSEMYPPSDERARRPFDYIRVAKILAAVDAARFFEENMPFAENRINKEELLRYACSLAPRSGSVLEFGIMSGRTLRILCEQFPEKIVHGFDSFKGLPEDWTHEHRRGAFTTGGLPPSDLPPNTRLHVGMFDETLPVFVEESDERIALLHLDCDVYSSARSVLFGLGHRLGIGSIVVFDEFLNYPGWRHHEYRALCEFADAFRIEYSYVAFASSYLSVAVRIDSEPRANSV